MGGLHRGAGGVSPAQGKPVRDGGAGRRAQRGNTAGKEGVAGLG